MRIVCSHHYPVDVAGSFRTDLDGGLVKAQQCDACGARRRGIKQRMWHRTASSGGSAWGPWVFGDWGPAMPSPREQLSAGTEHTSPEACATGPVEQSRRAGRQPVLRGLTADLMVDREAALRHVRMLITIHGFRLAELVPEAGAVEPRS